MQAFTRQLRFPDWVKPGLGGLALGVFATPIVMYVGPHVVITGNTTIGADNKIFQFASIGAAPQDKKYSGGPTRLELPVSVGPAATVGLSYRIAPHWGLYASYSVSRVDTRLTADTAGLVRTSHIAFGPQALVLSAGYSF